MPATTGILLDARREQPLHRQIFDQMVQRIRTGAFPTGFKLPPSRALARELHTHRNTVVRVYEDLEAAGFVTSRVGRGTFVAGVPAAAGAPAAGGARADRPPCPGHSSCPAPARPSP